MTGLWRKAAALSCSAALAAVAGCSSSPRAAVPAEFCKVPVPKAVLAPLIPEKGEVRQTYDAHNSYPSGNGADCFLSVGKKLILDLSASYQDFPLDLEKGWRDYDDKYPYAVRRPIDFPGYAIVGSDHADAWAICDSSSHLHVDVFFSGDRVDTSSTGYKRLLRLVDNVVPELTKRLCTP